MASRVHLRAQTRRSAVPLCSRKVRASKEPWKRALDTEKRPADLLALAQDGTKVASRIENLGVGMDGSKAIRCVCVYVLVCACLCVCVCVLACAQFLG